MERGQGKNRIFYSRKPRKRRCDKVFIVFYGKYKIRCSEKEMENAVTKAKSEGVNVRVVRII